MSGYSGGSDGLNPPVDDEQPVSGDVQQSLLKRVDELEEKMGAAAFDEKRVQGLIADRLGSISCTRRSTRPEAGVSTHS